MNLAELRKPNVPLDMAIELVRQIYGLEVTNIKRMVSFNDQNFHIQVSNQHQNPHIDQLSNDGHTLKIINTIKSSLDGHFDSMHSAMIYLNERGLRTPVPIRNLEGNTWKLEEVPLLNEDGKSQKRQKCGIHLLTFIPGLPICTIEPTHDILFQWGALLARFHNAIEDLVCPQLRNKSILYSLEHIPDIRHYMEGLDEERKKLVLKVLDRYPFEITKYFEKITHGFIHGDFNSQNILSQLRSTKLDGNLYSVDGILDFEDMHYGAYVWDVGLMLTHSLLDCKNMDPLEAAGHTLSGYLSIRSMNELELSLLKMCMECRLCQSTVLCIYSCRLDPNNSYVSILSSAETKWARLEQLCNTRNGDILKLWSDIFQQYVSNKTS